MAERSDTEQLVLAGVIIVGGYLLLTGRLFRSTVISAGGARYSSGTFLGRPTSSIVIPGVGAYSSGPLGTSISIPGLAGLFNLFGGAGGGSGAISGAGAGNQPLPPPPIPSDSAAGDSMPVDPSTGPDMSLPVNPNDPNLDPWMLADPITYAAAVDPSVFTDAAVIGATG